MTLADATAPADDARTALVQALSRVASGDRSALEDVYRRTSAKLFGVVLRILPDRQEAEDVLQDVYLTVWRKAAMFDPGRASPITWLATLARNRALDRVRARGPRSFVSDDILAATPDAAPLASETLAFGDDYRRVVVCLDGLDPGHASAVRQIFLNGLTYEALAQRIDTPIGTVKSWVRRSLIKLRACLGDAHD